MLKPPSQSIKLTSKRQATFPAELCYELGLKPGDELYLQPLIFEGHRAWVLQPKQLPDTQWMGSLKKYTKGKRHDMESIRKNIGKKLGK